MTLSIDVLQNRLRLCGERIERLSIPEKLEIKKLWCDMTAYVIDKKITSIKAQPATLIAIDEFCQIIETLEGRDE